MSYVYIGTPHLSLQTQSYSGTCWLAEVHIVTDSEREPELCVVFPEFPAGRIK